MLFGAINNWKRLESRKRPGNNNILLYYISFFPHYPQAAMLTLQLTGPYSTGSIVSFMYSLYTPQQYQSSSAHSVRSLTQSLIWDHSAHCHKNIGPKRPWLFFLLDDCCWALLELDKDRLLPARVGGGGNCVSLIFHCQLHSVCFVLGVRIEGHTADVDK